MLSALCLALAGLLSFHAAAAPPRTLFADSADDLSGRAIMSETLRERLVHPDLDGLHRLFAGETVRLRLFDNLDIDIAGNPAPGGVEATWYGRILGDPWSAVAVVRQGNACAIGIWSTQLGRFEILPESDGMLRIIEYPDSDYHCPVDFHEHDAAPKTTTPAPNVSPADSNSARGCDPADNGEFIDLLFAYSRNMAAENGPLTLRWRLLIQVAYANLGLENGQHTPRFRYVGQIEIDVDEATPCDYCDADGPSACTPCESCDFAPDCPDRVLRPCKGPHYLTFLHAGEPPYDVVHAKRDLLGADLMVGVFHTLRCGCQPAGTCQIGGNAHPLGPGLLINRNLVALAHELGHSLGVRHAAGAPSHRAYVYLKPGDPGNTERMNFRTIVSSTSQDFSEGDVAPEIPYYSTPTVLYPPSGVNVGDATHNAGGAFEQNRVTVSRLRDYADCNQNGIPDDCEIADDPSLDCNNNGRVDIDAFGVATPCEMDCNQNGIPDDCEIAQNPELDCIADGFMDSCWISLACRAAQATPPFRNVTLSDVTAVLSAYGTQSGEAGYACASDITRDGRIDIEDLAAVVTEYGNPCLE